MIIFNWPASGKFELAGLESKIKGVWLLANHQAVDFHQTAAGVTLDLPAAAPDKIASVVCVEITDKIARVSSPAEKPLPHESASN